MYSYLRPYLFSLSSMTEFLPCLVRIDPCLAVGSELEAALGIEAASPMSSRATKAGMASVSSAKSSLLLESL